MYKILDYTDRFNYSPNQVTLSLGMVRTNILDSWLRMFFFSTIYLTRIALEVIKEVDQTLLEKLGIVTFDDN